MLYLTDISTASKMLNLNNVAEVERKESLFSLPRCSNVSKKPHTNGMGSRPRGEQKSCELLPRSVQYGGMEHPPIQRLEKTRH